MSRENLANFKIIDNTLFYKWRPVATFKPEENPTTLYAKEELKALIQKAEVADAGLR